MNLSKRNQQRFVPEVQNGSNTGKVSSVPRKQWRKCSDEETDLSIDIK